MDQTSAAFRSASADLEQVSHNAAVDVDNAASGTILLKRPKPHDVHAFINFTKPDAKQVSVTSTTASIYYPKILTVQQIELGKHKALFDQFYLLGFGGSGKDLADAYEIKYAGVEDIKGSKASHLELTPKTAEVQKSIKKVDLWLAEATGYTAQLRLTVPSGDTTLLIYSNLKVNPKIDDSALKLKLPKGVRTVHPGQ